MISGTHRHAGSTPALPSENRPRKEVESLHMRYAVGIALTFCAVAFGQSSPNHFQLPDKLTDPHAQPTAQPRLLVGPKLPMGPYNGTLPILTPREIQVVPNKTECAIPLLNALPAKGNVDYKIQVTTPPTDPFDHMPIAKGIPACSPQR